MNTPINQVTINANLVENPELHYTNNGNPVTTFRVAHNKPVYDGGKGGGTVFLTVTCWGGLAKAVSAMPKGSHLTFYGGLDQQNWNGPDGKPRSRLVMVAQAVTSRAIGYVVKEQDYEPGNGSKSRPEDRHRYEPTTTQAEPF